MCHHSQCVSFVVCWANSGCVRACLRALCVFNLRSEPKPKIERIFYFSLLRFAEAEECTYWKSAITKQTRTRMECGWAMWCVCMCVCLSINKIQNTQKKEKFSFCPAALTFVSAHFFFSPLLLRSIHLFIRQRFFVSPFVPAPSHGSILIFKSDHRFISLYHFGPGCMPHADHHYSLWNILTKADWSRSQ